MKRILLTLAIVLGTMATASAAQDIREVQVEQVYDGWNVVNKIYTMTDEKNHKFCYIVNNSSDSVGIYCFDKESSK